MFAAVLIPSASFAATGDPCLPDSFEPSCNDDLTLQICDSVTDPEAPVEIVLTCADGYGVSGNPVCGTAAACIGACDGVVSAEACLSPLGSGCVGFGPRINADSTDNDFAFSLLCFGDATCSTQKNGIGVEDVCVPHIGAACTLGGGSSCSGNVLTFCFGDEQGTLALESNVAIDCGLFEGSTCGEKACSCDAQCGNNKCRDGVCEGGPNCVFPSDPADCISSEGEGEGESENENDNDNEGGNRGEPEEERTSSFCSTTGTMDASFGFALLGLVAVRRCRR